MMSIRGGLLCFILLVSFTPSTAEDGYRQCLTYEEITEPQLLKIEAPPPVDYAECTIQFFAPSRKYVELIFTEIDLGQLTMDYKDYNSCNPAGGGAAAKVEVYDSSIVGPPVCGQTNQLTPEQRTRRSTTRSMTLLFTNNNGHFQVQFNIVDTPGGSVCPSHMVGLYGYGTFKFPPDDTYLLHQRSLCDWEIMGSGAQRLKLTIRKMKVTGNITSPDPVCTADHYYGLHVFDGPYWSNDLLQQHCEVAEAGENVTELVSTGNIIFLEYDWEPTFRQEVFEFVYETIYHRPGFLNKYFR